MRRQWIFVASLLPLLALALVSVRWIGGTGGVASAQGPELAIDMVQDAGGTWCNPVQDSAQHTAGAGVYQVAICLLNSSAPASDFNIAVNYTPNLNSCANGDQSGTALNANPDFIGNIAAPSPSWNCSGGGQNPPTCNHAGANSDQPGTAFISCGTTDDPGTISGPWPIAVINFSAIAEGIDSLSFGTAALYDYDGENILRCPTNCVGATDDKSGPTPVPATNTPANTPQPTATSTPTCGGVEQPACPTSTATERPYTKTPSPEPTSTPGAEQPTAPAPPPPPSGPGGGQQPSVVVPPNTGTGSGGFAWTSALAWVLGSGIALSCLGGGLYLRRARGQ